MLGCEEDRCVVRPGRSTQRGPGLLVRRGGWLDREWLVSGWHSAEMLVVKILKDGRKEGRMIHALHFPPDAL